jgi:hypothetical protein
MNWITGPDVSTPESMFHSEPKFINPVKQFNEHKQIPYKLMGCVCKNDIPDCVDVNA